SVRLKGTKQVVTTDAKGQFTILMDESSVVGQSGNPVLVFSYVGMKTLEQVVDANQRLTIRMETSADAIKDVVVTGIFQREQESFTGSTTTYTGRELLRVGNTNVLQSLKTLDPAFAIIEN